MSFFFPFLLFCPLLPFFALLSITVLSSPFFRVYACTTAVPGVISLQLLRDRVQQVVIVPLPLRPGTAMHVLFCLFSSIETFIVACFVTTGWVSGR